ncbi:MAG: class I adenylate-forming enzyme family protein [Acidimicrobiales bacterium]
MADVRSPTDSIETGRDQWRWRVDATPDREFMRFEGMSWSFAEFDEIRRKVAAGLAAIGVGVGTRVAVGMTNRPEAIAVQLAIQELGAVLVPLLPDLTAHELGFRLGHSASEFLVVDGGITRDLLDAVADYPDLRTVVRTAEVEPVVGVADVVYDRVADADAVAPLDLPGLDARSLAMILYTSGSTGDPKGVMIGTGAFATVGPAFADQFGIGPEDNFYAPLPFAHAVGALTALGLSTHLGCVMTLADRFSPSTFWTDFVGGGITTSILFPTHLNLLLETGDGAPGPGEHPFRLVITHAYLRRFRERFGVDIATVWGMTETGAICTGSEPGYDGRLGENYIGTPMPGAEVGIFDENFEMLGPGEEGELCLRHPNVMLGYLDLPDETARTLVDGWIRSGDRGVIDEEGRAFFVGRFKNVIKRSGENISAEEVETALDRHADVVESVVFGVADPVRAEEVAAVVVVRSGSQVDAAELRSSTAETLVRWKQPRYIDLRTDPLPRLANGKVDRVGVVGDFDPGSVWDAQAD